MSEHSDRSHSKYSASSMSRLVNCTASIEFCKDMPNFSNPYSDEGTLAHEYSEHLFNGGTLQDFSRGDEVSLFMEANVESYLNDLELMKMTLFDEIIDVQSEKKRVSKHNSDWGGTLDFGVLGKRLGSLRALVLDLKYGRFPVYARNNLQLMTYAYLMVEENPEIEEVFLAIKQPNHMGNLSIWRPPIEKVREMPSILDKLLDSAANNPEFKVGRWCLWCPGLKMCKKFNSFMTEMVDYTNFNFMCEPTQDLVDKMAFYVKMSPVIRRFLFGLEDLVKSAMLLGARYEGHKVVRTLGNREFTDEDDVRAVCDELGIEFERTVTKTENKSPSQLQDDCVALAKEMKAKGEKASGAGLFRKHFQPFIERFDKGFEVVVEDDPRPEYVQESFESSNPFERYENE